MTNETYTERVPSFFSMHHSRKYLRAVAVAGIVTVVCGLIFAAVQQDLRLSADDPQIQLAEDAAVKLSNAASPQSVISNDRIAIETSLAPFVAVYDTQKKVLASDGRLHGELPVPPLGVFEYARMKGEHHFTWQPEPGVRIAVVLKKIDGSEGGFVMAGRSLREVEKREDQLAGRIAIGWIVALVLGVGAVFL